MNGDLKLSFIRMALNSYMLDVIKAMEDGIRKKNVKDTGALLNSLYHKVYQEAAEGNANLSFAEWGRFIDMGVGRGHPLGGIKGTRQALAANRKKGKHVRKPVKIYSPIIYGKLNGLIGDLSYGFTEEAIEKLKAETENGNAKDY